VVASNVLSDTGSLASTVRIYVNSSYTTFSFPLTYLTGSQSQKEVINMPVNVGDKIYAQIDTNSGTQPTRVIHNINLHIKRNG
jgi:hypothetical protein